VTRARISAIERQALLATLVGEHGDPATIHCGPEVDRFDQLKVGDTATFRYTESVAFAIRKAGQPSSRPKTTSEPVIALSKGPKPGATVSRQQVVSVTVETIDTSVPSLTVVSDGGRRLTFKVPRKRDLGSVRVGDKLEITYTRTMLISVE
jgi:hypothetical protein